jgi:hypothetical protein
LAAVALVATAGGPGCVGDWVRGRVFAAFDPVAMVADADIESHSARWCGECHAEIYDEWKGSRMASATTNDVFVADWNHAENARSEVCFKCHAPLERQQPHRVDGLSDAVPPLTTGAVNPSFDLELQREGVTCVVCHIQEGSLAGPAGRGAPASPATDDVHAFSKSAFVGAADQCAQCHQFEGVPFTRIQRPVADIVEEWRRWGAATGETDTCIDCHMPPVERASAEGSPVREGRRHTFIGGGDAELLRDGLDLEVVSTHPLTIALINRAGHRYPTGEPARAVELRVDALMSGATLSTQSRWLERVIELPRIRERSDSTLAPAERREFRFDVGGADAVVVSVLYHRAKNLPEVQAHLQLPPMKIRVDRVVVGP